METSKKITWTLLIFFLCALVAVAFVRIKFDIDISNLLNYIMPLTTSAALAYYGKSSLENITKIKTNPISSSVQVESNGSSIEINPRDLTSQDNQQ